MATQFYNVDGELVALRSWGGVERGTVVELQDGARFGELDTPLRGDDGSLETLRTLAEWVGRGRLTPAELVEHQREAAREVLAAERLERFKRERERERAEAFRAETGLQGRAARLLVKPRHEAASLWKPCQSCGTQTRYRSPHTGAPRCGRCLSG